MFERVINSRLPGVAAGTYATFREDPSFFAPASTRRLEKSISVPAFILDRRTSRALACVLHRL